MILADPVFRDWVAFADRHLDLSDVPWPRGLSPALRTYGPAVVYAAGLQALGYPPTWCASRSEWACVETFIGTHLRS